MSGFATIQRDARKHPLFHGDADRFGAWVWLILGAAWKPTPFDIAGKTVTLERGQICVSIRQLGDEWGWSKSKVDRFLTRLETETMIERKAGQGRCIITICNYEKYQEQRDTDRDNFMSPQQAKEYGIIDAVLGAGTGEPAENIETMEEASGETPDAS